MALTDQQLRQELLSFGETVPPITQRNRQQLQARLEQLRGQVAPRATAVKRSQGTPSRSRPVPGLIELSDSETENTPNQSWPTRSTAIHRTQETRSTPITSSVSAEVEQSIARHRREIQQLIESARERSLAINASIASGNVSPKSKPASPVFPSRTKSNSEIRKLQQPSFFRQIQTSVQSFWRRYRNPIVETFKALLIGTIFGVLLILLKTKGPDLIPQRKGITCSIKNATDCDEMIPVIDTIRRQLQIRAGEVDCGFRRQNELQMTKNEINKYLDQKGFRFELGEQERWKSLVTYILEKPVEDILVWNQQNKPAQSIEDANKLSSDDPLRPLSCRLRKRLNSAVQTCVWIASGTSIFLLIIWILKRRSKQREDNEKAYKDLVDKILECLENQYEEHQREPETKPWLAISHVRDMLISAAERKRLKSMWERAAKHINESESRVRAETQVIHGEEFDVWRWIQPHSTSSPSSPRSKRRQSPTSPLDQTYVYTPADVGLTQCLKLRNFFSPDNCVDNDEIDLVIDSIQNRCATVRHLEHIGINESFVYLKFSSKEAAAQGFHLLNNWKYHGREIIAKYLRLERYHEHFPEARESGSH